VIGQSKLLKLEPSILQFSIHLAHCQVGTAGCCQAITANGTL